MPKDEYIEGYNGLAIFQIAGGALGLIFLALLFSIQGGATWWFSLMLALGAAFYVFSFYCGIMIFRKDASSLKMSLVNQYLQLLSISAAPFTYEYISGFGLSWKLGVADGLHMHFSFSLSSWTFIVFPYQPDLGFSINLIAAAAIMYLHYEIRAIEREKLRARIDEIGSE